MKNPAQTGSGCIGFKDQIIVPMQIIKICSTPNY
jgi:hypothetical protein